MEEQQEVERVADTLWWDKCLFCILIYSSLRGKGIAKWMLMQVLFCTCALSNPTPSKHESDQEGPEMLLCPVHSTAES